jgi:hypothetical protein
MESEPHRPDTTGKVFVGCKPNWLGAIRENWFYMNERNEVRFLSFDKETGLNESDCFYGVSFTDNDFGTCAEKFDALAAKLKETLVKKYPTYN